MDDFARLKMLSAQMSLEMDVESAAQRSSASAPFSTSSAPLDRLPCEDEVFIHPAVLPGGKKIKLLKTLLSSACERDCYYCPFRAGRDLRRATFQPEEFARLFIQLVDRGIAEGVFLSSGVVGGGVRTQDKLIDTAEILRKKLNFRGYIHLKVMPGAEKDQVLQAFCLADRVSINLEAPNDERLARLAPHKQFSIELLQPLKWMAEIRASTPPPQQPWRVGTGRLPRWPSSVTQFVAGGAGESDLELLTTTAYLYNALGLVRAYFSAFSPIQNTPLEDLPPTSAVREHRLYQASYLLRDYGFSVEELPFVNDGQLPLEQDPKLAWAQKNLVENPIEINRADRNQLLRIPGIGVKGVDAIIRFRRRSHIRSPETLRHLGIKGDRARPYLLFDGRAAACQLSLM